MLCKLYIQRRFHASLELEVPYSHPRSKICFYCKQIKKNEWELDDGQHKEAVYMYLKT
jgi:hypothetical protein